MKKILKARNYILAAIIPIIIISTIFAFRGVWNDIELAYVSDLRLQHLVFLSYLKSVLLGKASLFYTFSAGLGSQMLSTIIFYCISPINILLIFIKNVQYAIIIIYIVKASLAGLTMYIYLKRKVKVDNFFTVLFAMCYALCSFMISFEFCVFWLDCVYFAPLVLIGIDRIIEEEKMNFLYIFTLAATIICNIQMGFGLCIFCVIYYLYAFALKYNIKNDFKKFKKISILFIISSLFAGLISSGALLGFAEDIGKISSARNITTQTFSSIANPWYILKNFMSVGHLSIDYLNYVEPYVYSGLAISFLSVLYFFNKSIDKNKRKCAFLVILVFIVSFCITPINTFWHISVPVMLNFRYSIYLILFLVMLAFENYVNLSKIDSNHITVMSIMALLGLSVYLFSRENTYVVVSIIFLAAEFSALILAKNRGGIFEKLLIIVMLSEIVVSYNGSLYLQNSLAVNYENIHNYYDEFMGNCFVNNEGEYYRITYNNTYTDLTNDTLMCGVGSSLRYFSSIVDGKLLMFWDKIGGQHGNNAYMYSAFDTPLMSSILGQKYIYSKDKFIINFYDIIDTITTHSLDYETGEHLTDDVYLYSNPYAPSIGYVIEKDVIHEDGMNMISFQNAIFNNLTGVEGELLHSYNYKIDFSNDVCINDNPTGKYCVGYLIENDNNSSFIFINMLFSEIRFQSNIRGFNFDVSNQMVMNTGGKDANIIFLNADPVDANAMVAYSYDKDLLIKGLKKLQSNMLENIVVDKNTITADINSSKDGTLFLAIPYDKHFKIYVDDKKQEFYPTLDDTFIGLDITEGEHHIYVEYVNEYFKYYLLASGISLVLCIIVKILVNKKCKKIAEKERQEQEAIELARQQRKEKKKSKKK